MVYSNQLIYAPMQNSFGIVRTSAASIPIECHYKRFELCMVIIIYTSSFLLSCCLLLYICCNLYLRTHFVSSIDVKPSREPFTSTKTELIGFSFYLMNGKFRFKIK